MAGGSLAMASITLGYLQQLRSWNSALEFPNERTLTQNMDMVIHSTLHITNAGKLDAKQITQALK